VAAADGVGFEHEGDGVGVVGAVEGDGEAFFEADGDLFGLMVTSSRQKAVPMMGATIFMLRW
jgi:hypothetical protein